MQTDTLQFIQFGWGVLQFFITAAVWLYAWSASRSRARKDDLDALRRDHDQRLRKTEDAVNRLDERIQHMPTAGLVAELRAAVTGIQSIIGAIDSRTSRIEDYLNGKRATA